MQAPSNTHGHEAGPDGSGVPPRTSVPAPDTSINQKGDTRPVLEALIRRGGRLTYPSPPPSQIVYPEIQEQVLNEICDVFESQTGITLAEKERNVLVRRVGWRMHVNAIGQVKSYLTFMQRNPSEVEALRKNLRSSITSFFREPDDFMVLEQKVLPELFSGKKPRDTIQVWVSGCGAGEEAYSLAILLHSYANKLKKPPRLQIYATDQDEQSLKVAREGYYPNLITTDLSESCLVKYFEPEKEGYRLKEEIRNMVYFALHEDDGASLYTNLDLLTCRNLYMFEKDKVCIHFKDTLMNGLRLGGYLLLGRPLPEEIPSKVFSVIDPTHGIYQRLAAGELPPTFRIISLDSTSIDPNEEDDTLPYVAVEDDAVGSLHFETYASPFTLSPSDMTQQIMPSNELQFEHYNGVSGNQDIKEQAEAAKEPPLWDAVDELPGVPTEASLSDDDADASEEDWQLSDAEKTELVAFTKYLEQELKHTRSLLSDRMAESEKKIHTLSRSQRSQQATIEALKRERTELETQLVSLKKKHQQMKGKALVLKQMQESGAGNIEDLVGLSGVGILHLDANETISMFTPEMGRVFQLTLSDIGRPIQDLNLPFAGDMVHWIKEAVITGNPVREVARHPTLNTWYAIEIRQKVDAEEYAGVIITCLDISSQKAVEEGLRFKTEILNQAGDAIIATNRGLQITYMNRAAEVLYQVDFKHVAGWRLSQLFRQVWRSEEEKNMAFTALRQSGRWIGENQHLMPSGRRIKVQTSISLLRDLRGIEVGMIAIIRDQRNLDVEKEKVFQNTVDRLQLKQSKNESMHASKRLRMSSQALDDAS